MGCWGKREAFEHHTDVSGNIFSCFKNTASVEAIISLENYQHATFVK
jgi:hypothetical protein